MASNLLEYAKRAAVRRVVYVLVALALGFVGIGRAEAQTYTCTPNPSPCDRELAHAECLVRADAGTPHPSWERECRAGVAPAKYYDAYYRQTGQSWTMIGNPNRFRWTDECPAGQQWSEATKSCSKDCSAEADLGPGAYVASQPEICQDECGYEGSGSCVGGSSDGQDMWTCNAWSPTGETCATGDTPAPGQDTDGDGSSDGNDAAPNNPGQGGGGENGPPGEDGGGQGEGSGPGGGQGNGSGEGSGNGNTAGGGGDCGTPPSVTGDAALAMIAYQTWATRCAVEQGNAEGNGEEEPGDDDLPGDAPFNEGEEAEDESEDPAEVPAHTFDIPSMLDMSGFMGGGSCPEFGSITMGPFGTHDLGGDWFCEWLPVFRAFIIMMAGLSAIKILLGWNG